MSISHKNKERVTSTLDRAIVNELIAWLSPILDEENASKVIRASLKAAKRAKDAGVSASDFIAGQYHIGKVK